MKKLSFLLTLFVTVLFVGCAPPKGWVKKGDTSTLVHEKTKLEFPEVIGEFKRTLVEPASHPGRGAQATYIDTEKNKISIYLKEGQDPKEYFELSKYVMVKTGIKHAIESKNLVINVNGINKEAFTQRGRGHIYTYEYKGKAIYLSFLESVSVFDMSTYALKVRSTLSYNPKQTKEAVKKASGLEATILNELFKTQ